MHLCRFAFLLGCLLPGTLWAQSRESTPAPFAGQRALAQMISDMLFDLGPAPGPGARPQTKAPALPVVSRVTSETSQAIAQEIQQAKTNSATTPQPLLPASVILEHQDLHFRGNEPWEDLSLAVFCSTEKFEINVRSPFPVQLWTLFTQEGSYIASGSTPDLDNFYFLIDADYRPPYLLVLYVNYHDTFYKLKVLLE